MTSIIAFTNRERGDGLEVCYWDNEKIHNYYEKEIERLKKYEEKDINKLETEQLPFYISVEEILED